MDETRSTSSETLKVAFLHQPWSIVHPGETGADSVVLWTDQVARRLARRGCDVTCYSRAAHGLPVHETRDGVEHRRVSGGLDRYVKFAFRKLDQWGLRDARRPGFASPLAYRQFVTHVARDLADDPPDVVHVHNFSQFVPILRKALPPATRIALHMHCEWLTQLDAGIVARRLAHADLVIGVSEFLAGKICDRFPQLAARVRRVWNGADVEQFDIGLRTRVRDPLVTRLLYVGRVSPEKGIHTLLDAFELVARQRQDVHLRIVGPERIVAYEMIVPFCEDDKVLELSPWYRGGYVERLRSQVGMLPGERVEYREREVPHPDLPRVYADADIFVFPSIWDEPFGMPLVEAMSAGLPCIATRNGAFPEIVTDGETGLLVDRADPQALAEAILRLASDPELRLRMSAAARRRAQEQFSWDHVADALLAEYARSRQAAPAAAAERESSAIAP